MGLTSLELSQKEEKCRCSLEAISLSNFPRQVLPLALPVDRRTRGIVLGTNGSHLPGD